MARTYIPEYLRQVHELHTYLARYGATLLAAITIVDPGAAASFTALTQAVAAIDTLRLTLDPEGD